MPNARPPRSAARHLHLVPPLNAGPARPRQPAPPQRVVNPHWDRTRLAKAVELHEAAGSVAAEVLGRVFRQPAERIAGELSRQGQAVLRRGRPQSWAAAIVWLLAEDNSMLGRPNYTSTELAHRLGVRRDTVVAKVELLRGVIGPAARRVHR